jgi:hypothetical protein
MSKFIAALECGGLMESSEIYYTDGQIVEAINQKEAEGIYNENNNCSFFYGTVVAKKVSDKWKIRNHRVTKHWLQLTLNQNKDECNTNT